MSKSKKGGRIARQKSALNLLEARYEKFKATKQDKDYWITHQNTKLHKGCSYKEECSRLCNEIAILKSKLNKVAI